MFKYISFYLLNVVVVGLLFPCLVSHFAFRVKLSSFVFYPYFFLVCSYFRNIVVSILFFPTSALFMLFLVSSSLYQNEFYDFSGVFSITSLILFCLCKICISHCTLVFLIVLPTAFQNLCNWYISLCGFVHILSVLSSLLLHSWSQVRQGLLWSVYLYNSYITLQVSVFPICILLFCKILSSHCTSCTFQIDVTVGVFRCVQVSQN